MTITKHFAISSIVTIILISCSRDEISPDNSKITYCFDPEPIMTMVSDSVPIWPAGEKEYGDILGYKLNKEWCASAFATIHKNEPNKLNLSFITYYFTDLPKEILQIRNVPKKTGCYEIWPKEVADNELVLGDYNVLDFDVFEDSYNVYKEDGIINRLYIDTVTTNSIKGKLVISFVKNKNKNHTTISPDKIRFYNTEFTVKLP